MARRLPARGRAAPAPPGAPAASGAPAAKPCARCGRAFAWRRRWARTWDEVRYCSDACRRARVAPGDRALEQAVLDLLAAREAGKTICPSEAARAVGGAEWRALLPATRYAVNRLAAAGRVVVTQGGRVVDAETARGPIRVRLP